MEKKIKFEFNVLEINIILKGLRELAYKESSGLIKSIIATYDKQASEMTASSKDADKNLEIAKQVGSSES